jgi:hypothetical protein
MYPLYDAAREQEGLSKPCLLRRNGSGRSWRQSATGYTIDWGFPGPAKLLTTRGRRIRGVAGV